MGDLTVSTGRTVLRKLRLDDPLDFSEGDHGVSGGIQVRRW